MPGAGFHGGAERLPRDLVSRRWVGTPGTGPGRLIRQTVPRAAESFCEAWRQTLSGLGVDGTGTRSLAASRGSRGPLGRRQGLSYWAGGAHSQHLSGPASDLVAGKAGPRPGSRPAVASRPTAAFARGSGRDAGPQQVLGRAPRPGAPPRRPAQVPRPGAPPRRPRPGLLTADQADHRVRGSEQGPLALPSGVCGGFPGSRGCPRAITSPTDAVLPLSSVDGKDELERSSGLRILEAGVGPVSIAPGRTCAVAWASWPRGLGDRDAPERRPQTRARPLAAPGGSPVETR